MTHRSNAAPFATRLLVALLISVTPLLAFAEAIPGIDIVSDQVGATPGEFNVDASGAATYSVPIFTAPAPGGVAPQLALSYSSRSGHGALGVGWGISGTSSIERCRKTTEHGDGVGPFPAVDFSANDVFCLDGQRLVQLPTTNCPSIGGVTTLAEFRTELESFARICAYQGDSVTNGPSRFTVERRDGSVAQYGFTPNSSIEPNDGAGAAIASVRQRWALNRTRQPTGAYIDYVYSEAPTTGEHMLTEVHFTGLENPVKPTDAKVVFTYGTMSPTGQRVDFVSGSKVTLSKRLTTVSSYGPVYVNGTPTSKLLREYKLAYDENTLGSGQPRIVNIEECASAYTPSGTATVACRPKTVFGWQAAERGYANATHSRHWSTSAAFDHRSGDFDGDGRDDLALVSQTNGIRRTSEGQSSIEIEYQLSVHLAGTPSSTLPLGLNNGVLLSPTIHGGFCAEVGAGVCSTTQLVRRPAEGKYQIYDFNGDGRDDFLISTLQGTTNIFLTQAGGNAVDAGHAALKTGELARIYDSNLVDVDGDGLPDLVYRLEDIATGGPQSEIRIRRMVKALTGSAPEYVFGELLETGIVINDAPDAPLGIPMSHSSTTATDIDADGRADLMLKYKAAGASTATWHVFRNTGINMSNQLTFAIEKNTGIAYDAGRVGLRDLNGDGLPDLVIASTEPGTNAGTVTVEWWLNTGARLGARTSIFESSRSGVVTATSAYGNSGYWNGEGGGGFRMPLADVNTDGFADLVYAKGNLTTGCVGAPSPSCGTRPLVARLGSSTGFSSTETAIGNSEFNFIGTNGVIEFDVDGDGDSERLRYTQTNSTQSGNNTAFLHAQLGRAYERDSLKSITNGLGAVVQIEYAPMTHSSVYKCHGGATALSFGKGSPSFDTFSAMAVVKSVKRSLPTTSTTNMHETRYQYRGARVQAGGRGFLGFERRTEIDVASKIATTVQFRQDFPYMGQAQRTLVELLGAVPSDACSTGADTPGCLAYSQGQDAVDVGDLSLGGTMLRTSTQIHHAKRHPTLQIHFPFVESSSESVYSLLGVKQTQTEEGWSYTDDTTAGAPCVTGTCGNLKTHTKTWYQQDVFDLLEDLSESTTHSYSGVAGTTGWGNFTTTSRWQLGLIGETSVRRQRLLSAIGQSDVTRTERFGYDTKGLLDHTVTEPDGGKNLFLRTTLARDPWGNVTQTVRCSSDFSQAQCSAKTGFQQRQWENDRAKFMRYTSTAYSTDGRFVSSESVPFYDANSNLGKVQATFTIADADRNALGQPLKRTEASNVVTESSYGHFGQEQFRRDSTGAFQYTKVRLCTAVACPAGSAYRVDTNSQLGGDFTSANIAIAPTTLSYFDLLGREVARTTRLINSTAGEQWSSVRSEYNDRGQVARVSVPHFTNSAGAEQTTNGSCNNIAASGCWEAKEYDALGRTTQITKPDLVSTSNALTTISYDETAREVKQVTWQTASSNVTHRSISNSVGETTKVIERINGVDKFSELHYAAFGELAKISKTDTLAGQSNPTEVALTAQFDTRGRKIISNDPDKGQTTHDYNALGELIFTSDAANTTEKRYYDALGRVHRKTHQYPGSVTDVDERSVYDQVAAASNTAAAGTSSPQPELVTNGSFATSKSSWQTNSYTVWQSNTGNGNSGAVAVANNGYAFQSSIAIDPRMQYRVSFWRKVPSYYFDTARMQLYVTHWANQMLVQTDGLVVITGAPGAPVTAVENLIVTPHPTATELKLEFRVTGAGGQTMIIDDVSLRATSPYPPDPMAIWTIPAAYQYGRLISREDATVLHKRHFSYDALARPVGESWFIDIPGLNPTNAWTEAATEYDVYGRVSKRFDPDYKDYVVGASGHGLVDGVQYDYASTGHLFTEKDLRTGTQLRKVGFQSARGQSRTESYSANNKLSVSRDFDERTGLQTAQEATADTSKVQDIEYSYDKIGNVTVRDNKISGKREVFAYDSVNRLTGAKQANIATPTALSDTLVLSYDAFGNIASKNGEDSIYGVCTAVPPVTCTRPHGVKLAMKQLPAPATDIALGMSVDYDNAGNVTSTRWDRLATNAVGATMPGAVIKRAARTLQYYNGHRLSQITSTDQQRLQGAAAGTTFDPDWDHGTQGIEFFDYGTEGELIFRQRALIDLKTHPSQSIPLLPKSVHDTSGCGDDKAVDVGSIDECRARAESVAAQSRQLKQAFAHDPQFLSALEQMEASGVHRPLKYSALRRMPKVAVDAPSTDADRKGQSLAKSDATNDTCATTAPAAVPLNDKIAWIFGNTEFAYTEFCDNARRRNIGGYVNIEQRQSRDVNNRTEFKWTGGPRATTTVYTYQLSDPLGSVDVQVRMDANNTFTPVAAQATRNPRRVSFDAHGQQRNAGSFVDVNKDGDYLDAGEVNELTVALTQIPYFERTRTRVEGTAQGFAGHQNFNHVGLVHMKGRIYDPTLGRFLQPDPIVEDDLNPQSWNRYSYVRNNPLTFTDPTGLVTKGSNGCAARCQAHETRRRQNWIDTGGTFSGGSRLAQVTVTPSGASSASISNGAGSSNLQVVDIEPASGGGGIFDGTGGPANLLDSIKSEDGLTIVVFSIRPVGVWTKDQKNTDDAVKALNDAYNDKTFERPAKCGEQICADGSMVVRTVKIAFFASVSRAGADVVIKRGIPQKIVDRELPELRKEFPHATKDSFGGYMEPYQGTMYINSKMYAFSTYDEIKSTYVHEMGHGFGLMHQLNDVTSAMNYSTTNRRVSLDDVNNLFQSAESSP